MSAPHPCVEILMRIVLVFGVGASGTPASQEGGGGALMNGMRAHIKETPKSFLPVSTI